MLLTWVRSLGPRSLNSVVLERIDQMRGKPRPSQLAAQQLGGEAA